MAAATHIPEEVCVAQKNTLTALKKNPGQSMLPRF
jgi:hypothetical protein